MAQNDIAGKPVTVHRQGPVVAIGLMSGTSMDGIDVALLRTDGEDKVERGPAGAFDYDPAFRKRLAAALETAKTITERDQRPDDLAELERELTLRHVMAVREFIDRNGLHPADIDVIGFHGQTVLHRPEQCLTVQLGDGGLLARETGIATVHDLRANDMAHGGQGAPLVPVYHRALSANLPADLRKLPVAFVNIGGIANITWVGNDGSLVAFDTGPGNALIDQWVTAHAGIPYDPQGTVAAEGAVLMPLAQRYLADDFFSRNAPKSLDRNDFLPPEPEEVSLEDGARTLAYVTAASIWKAAEHVPQAPNAWVICGGGRRNQIIMQDLVGLARENARQGGQPAQVILAEEAGFDGDAMEAEAWAYLAVRSLRELEITWPSTTGCREAVTGGQLALP
ncbi:MAG: anhydro-N-acetylmuramic acid kinase [Salaquimonas sp.]|jgi:anhydro-N-acetylmuramic acid kinase|nr:anhydro-N-acetylmuramic acid kinase [Salaquimonas sp.]